MARFKWFAAAVVVPAITLGLASVLDCAGGPGGGHDDPGASPESLTGCAFSVTQNSYDGPNYWGAITVKNTGATSWTGFKIEFNVPTGAHCTNDTVPSGATLSPLTGSGTSAYTTSNHCKFTWSSASLASGASTTFNYSTTSSSFSAASNAKATSASCGGTGTGGSGGSTGTGG